MNDEVLQLSPLTRREMRMFFAFLAPLLTGLFLYNVLTINPSLSRTQTFIYALFTLLWILDYSLIFLRPTQLFSKIMPSLLFWVSLEALFAYGIVQILGGRATPYIFLLVFDWYTVAIFASRWIALALVTILTGIVGISYGLVNGWQAGLNILGANLVWIVLAVVSAEAFVRQWQQRDHVEKLLAELEQAHQQLREYAVQAEELAVAQERARLAHELHDSVGHTLTALDVQMELLVRLPAGQTEQRRQAARQARALVKEGLADARRAVQALHPLALETFSLLEATAKLTSDFENATQIPVVSEMDSDLASLPPTLVVPLYRAVQEALTNVQRHAPAATQVTMQLRCQAEAVSLSVENDGLPLTPEVAEDLGGQEGGYGLRGLRERAEALGGTFRAGPDEAGSFRVEMRLPRADVTANL